MYQGKGTCYVNTIATFYKRKAPSTAFNHSFCTAPVVTVKNENGALLLCADYSTRFNGCIDVTSIFDNHGLIMSCEPILFGGREELWPSGKRGLVLIHDHAKQNLSFTDTPPYKVLSQYNRSVSFSVIVS
uniref:CN hydrolase domain-containing protein n=1 Tax=Heterorhabditis bacteriophora TaxID=37862 RepID=A0A1I7XRX9_HETBA